MKKIFVLFLLLPVLASNKTEAQWSHDPANPKVVCNAPESQSMLGSLSDGNGGVYIAWADLRNLSLTGFDIYVQHLSATGTDLWPSNGVSICSATQYQGTPAIVSDGAGGIIVAWIDLRNGVASNIYAQRVNASGVVQWTSNGIPVRNLATTHAENFQLIADGNGGAIVTWQDSRNGSTNYDIYAQKINAGGNAMWTSNGVPLCSAPFSQVLPQLVSDLSGGAIVCWTDRRTDEDVYAQRIDAAGTVQWTINGVAIGAANDFQRYPSIVSDLSGGAVIAFEDYRNGSAERDVYAQWINTGGSIQWQTNGVVLCDAANHQSLPKLINAGTGEYLVVWQDARSGVSQDKIYIQRIDQNGNALFATNGLLVSPTTGTYSLHHAVKDENNGVLIHYAESNIYYVQKINQNGITQWPGAGVRYTTQITALPPITSDESGGAILAMQIGSGSNENVYAQRIFSNGQFCAAPPIVDLGTDIAQCQEQLVLDAGNSGLSFLWSNAATTQSISISTGGSFHVLVSDGGEGCSDKDTILVTMHPLPNVFLGSDRSVCGTSEILWSGNSTATSYLWSTTETTEYITITQSGSYSVTVSDNNNCTNSQSVNITLVPYAVVDLGGPYTTCGESILLDAGNPGASYNWSSGETTQTINASASGNYNVAVTLNGCTINSSASIINEAISVNLGPDFSACGQATLDAGHPGSDYTWSTGENTQSITISISGNYEVTVSNVAGCTASNNVDVTILEVPSAEIGPSSMEVCDGEVLSFDIPSTAGVLDYTITNGFQSSNFSALNFTYDASMPPVLVQCDVTAQNGCTSQDIVSLIDNSLYNLAWIITNVNDPLLEMEVIALPATVDTWYWDFGDGTTAGQSLMTTHTYIANGSYDVCVIALNECDSIADCVTVTITATGLDEIHSLNESVDIRPSLSTGQFTLYSSANSMLNWRIIDISGREIYSGKTNQAAQFIDLSFAAGGLYFVHVDNGKENVIRKIVIEK